MRSPNNTPKDSDVDERTAPIHRRARRAKVASLVAGTLGAPAMLTGAFAKPASGESLNSNQESPHAFINDFARQLSDLASYADKHHLGVVNIQGNSRVHIFLEKNPNLPNAHDVLAIVTDQHDNPNVASGGSEITINSEGMKQGVKRSRYPYVFELLAYNSNFKANTVMPGNSMELAIGHSRPESGDVFTVGQPDPNDMFMQAYKRVAFEDNEGRVSEQYSAYLAQAKSIIQHCVSQNDLLNFFKTHGTPAIK